jgi:cation:H+ antiporter
VPGWDVVTELAFAAGLLLVGIGVLYFGADWLVQGSSRLAAGLGVPPIVVGLTVVSFGTSAPELVVSLMAAMGGSPDLSMGNVLGSNLANIGLILGLTSVIRPLEVHARVVWREAPLMLLLTAALFPLLWDGGLARSDGVLLLLALAAYLLFVFHSAEDESAEILEEYEGFVAAASPERAGVHWPDLLWVFGGCAGLVVGGYLIVRGAVDLTVTLGIPEVDVGLTIVAVGTSLPELATSLVAAAREEADIAVGNVIGSNIFNVAAILGATALVQPIPVDPTVLVRELPAVLGLTLLLLPVLRTGSKIRRWEGALLLGCYVALAVVLI